MNIKTCRSNLSLWNIRSLILAIPNYSFKSFIIPPRHNWIIDISISLSWKNDYIRPNGVWRVKLGRIKFVEQELWVAFFVNDLWTENDLVIVLFVEVLNKCDYACPFWVTVTALKNIRAFDYETKKKIRIISLSLFYFVL